MKRAITAERRNKLAQIVVTNGSIRIGEIAEMFNVSTETIRKDIIYLDKEGIAKKSHGGAISLSEIIERPVPARILENLDAKIKIAQSAFNLIPENGVIFLDAGSTILSLAKLIRLKKGLTIITNSLSAVNILIESENNIYLTGGEVWSVTMSLEGFWTTSAIKTLRPDVAFIGTSGFNSRNGPTSKHYVDAETKRNVIENSRMSVVLGDNSKFNSSAFIEYALWKEIDCFITDEGAPRDILERIQGQTKVIIAK